MTTRLPFRVLTLVTGGFGVLAGLEAWNIHLETRSTGARLGAIAAGLTGIWLVLSGLFPVIMLGLLARFPFVTRTRQRLEQEVTTPDRRGLAAGMVIFGAVCLGVNLWTHRVLAPTARMEDQAAYLERAERMQSAEGAFVVFPKLIGELRSGRFREDCSRSSRPKSGGGSYQQVAPSRALSRRCGQPGDASLPRQLGF
jgi:hypothetical protein